MILNLIVLMAKIFISGKINTENELLLCVYPKNNLMNNERQYAMSR